MTFLVGLAKLLGQFTADELQAHEPGLILLMNDAIAGVGRGSDLAGAFPADTSMVVIQRVAGQIAR